MAKVAVVGVVGRTNAGKSTLVNALVGEKVSIVSPVEQTTRNTIRGIVADPRGQLVLLDTPGLHKAVGELGRILNRMARRSAAGTDITCVVFDASEEPQMEDVGWMQRVAKEQPEKVVFVLNKADKAPFYETMYREAWEEARKSSYQSGSGVSSQSGSGVSPLQDKDVNLLSRSGETPLPLSSGETPLPLSSGETHPSSDIASQCSLRSGDMLPLWVKSIASTPGGAKSVADALFDLAEEGEKLFDDEIVTDYPRKLTIADSIREKYLAKLHQELPHELGVVVKTIREKTEKGEPTWEVEAEILVNRASQKPIVIGKGAATIKYVRKCSERELSDLFGVKVKMELWVRVEPHWMKNQRLLAEMGYLGELV